MNPDLYILLAILVCSLCTILVRVIPFILFGGKHGMPGILRRVATRLPAAIIAVLVIYCVKNVPGAPANEVIAAAAAILMVVGLHLWRKNTLLSIAGGTVLYMILLRVL
ncbi:MAG: AzlD domain-containing protein [Clostridia bacterium]|nr:AzlD domain-containing protein [Clostridia bacterium]